MTRSLLATLIATVAATGFAGAVHAADVGQHPAVFAPRSLPGVDPSTFIVAHPAQTHWVAGHANHEHPAVTRASAVSSVDSNRFLVQPPATTQWLVDVPVTVSGAVHAMPVVR